MVVVMPPLAMAEQAPPGLEIIDKPIAFGPLRQELTLAYIRSHYNPLATSLDIVPIFLVVHWTGNTSFTSAFNTFYPEALDARRKRLVKHGRLNVSSHFLIDRQGNIFRLMPETRMARQTIGLNPVAIGIENLGDPDHPLTAAQLAANASLVDYLAHKYKTLQFLIGHFEYHHFRGTPFWKEKNDAYFSAKIDPGVEFMERLRRQVSHLGLKARPTTPKDPPK